MFACRPELYDFGDAPRAGMAATASRLASTVHKSPDFFSTFVSKALVCVCTTKHLRASNVTHDLPWLPQVGAMSELKKDMSRWQSLLQGRLVEEMEETLYALKV